MTKKDEGNLTVAVITACFILIAILSMFGGNTDIDYSYTPPNESMNLSDLPDDVEEDMLIYGILKSQGYSDEESAAAVINTMDKSSF
jgi:hypothetical protein